MAVRIKEIEHFTTRVKNALRSAGLVYDTDISRISARDLQFITDIGRKGYQSVIDYSAEYGIKINKKRALPFKLDAVFGLPGLNG